MAGEIAGANPAPGGTISQAPKAGANQISLAQPQNISYTVTLTNISSFVINAIFDSIDQQILYVNVTLTDANGTQTPQRFILWQGDSYIANPDWTHQNIYDAVTALLGA